MKRLFAVVRSLVICLLVIMGVATQASATDQVDPTEFVPLEVGNRWIYYHSYQNEMYYERERFWRRYGEPDEYAAYWEAYFKQFEVPGYPMGESYPPESLTHPDGATLVVEITHTEWIDGFEYFVFSEASYDWPPLPTFFWAGQKVRLSEDGILFFHQNGTHIPLYDFKQDGVIYYSTLTSATSSEYIDSDRGYLIFIDKWMSDRLTDVKYPNHVEVVINPAYQDQVLEVGFRFRGEMTHSLTDWTGRFVRGYGVGRFKREILGFHNHESDFWSVLSPISAILSGEEVSFDEKATSEFVSLVEPEFPPIVGRRDTLRSGESGFDFSEGRESHSFLISYEKSDIKFSQIVWHGEIFRPASLKSSIGMADLGRVNFGRLVSAGPADLRPDPPDRRDAGEFFWSQIPQEGHTYAFWTQEGGIALMHILDIVRGHRLGAVSYILFDWVYYPASDGSPNATSVQPTSWGQLKNSLLRMK